jgi:hypothetical protein
MKISKEKREANFARTKYYPPSTKSHIEVQARLRVLPKPDRGTDISTPRVRVCAVLKLRYKTTQLC